MDHFAELEFGSAEELIVRLGRQQLGDRLGSASAAAWSDS
jgi:hypothetical protein